MRSLGMRCELCEQREAVAQQCPGDYADHGHGMVHTKNEGLLAVCAPCGQEVAVQWGTALDPITGRYVRRPTRSAGAEDG